MALVRRLSVILGAGFSLLLNGLLWSAYRAERRHLQAQQEFFILSSVEALAAHCASLSEPDFKEGCLAGLGIALPAAEPEAFSHAVVADSRSKVLLSSGLLAAGDPHIRDAIAAEGPQVRRQVLSASGERLAYVFAPLSRPEGRGAVLCAWREAGLAKSSERFFRATRLRFLGMTLLGTALGILLAMGLVFYFLGPLETIAEGIRRVAQGDFNRPVPENKTDELGELGAEFNRMTSRLAETDALKDSFVAKVTHDLRNPLSAILGYAETLLKGYEGPVSPRQARTLEAMLTNGRSLAELVNSILDVTRLEAGRMEFEPTLMDIHEAVESAVELMRLRAQECKVRLEMSLDGEARQIWADPQALQRVLVNLISNAIKFTPEGGRVLVKTLREKPGETVCVVSDTGIGVPKERMASLFAKFPHIPETRDKLRPSEGTGLGLVICKEIVEALGGRIWVESRMFRGTDVYFSLPERGPEASVQAG